MKGGNKKESEEKDKARKTESKGRNNDANQTESRANIDRENDPNTNVSNKLKESESNTELKKRKDDKNQKKSNKCEDSESKTTLHKKDNDKKLNEPTVMGNCETEYGKMKNLEDNQGSGDLEGEITSSMDGAYPFFKNNMDSYVIDDTSSSPSCSTCDSSDTSPYTCEPLTKY